MRRIITASIVILIAGVQPAMAQTCLPDETVNGCLKRLTSPEKVVKAGAQAAGAAEKAVAKKTEAGVSSPENGLPSSMKDFLPILQMTGALGTPQKDEQTGIVKMAVNVPGPGGSPGEKDRSIQMALLLNTKGTLYAPLKADLGKVAGEALQKQLGDQADRLNLGIDGGFNVMTGKFGRDFNRQAPRLQRLFETAAMKIAGPELSARAARSAGALVPLLTRLSVDPDVMLFKNMPPAAQGAIDDAIALALGDARALADRVQEAVKASGLDIFGDLVNNRPQIHVSASHWWRDQLYGPETTSIQATFEFPWGNSINGYLSQVQSLDCEGADADRCLAKYHQFAQSPDLRANLKASSRMAISFQYDDVAAWAAPESSGSTLTSDRTSTWSLSATVGRLVGVNAEGVADGRIDASVKAERPKDTTIANHRVVASLVYTKKAGTFSIPLGLVYANRSAFLNKDDYDHGLSAHVGLKFNLFSQTK